MGRAQVDGKWNQMVRLHLRPIHPYCGWVSMFLRLGARRPSAWRESLLVLCLSDMLSLCCFLEAMEVFFFLEERATRAR